MSAARYLLDSHALIWWWIDSPRLSTAARDAIANGAAILVSAATVWELATLTRLGRLKGIEDFADSYAPLMARNSFTTLPVTDTHALRAGLMGGDHRDPFDRMIAAQSLIEGLPVITRDPALAAFGCEVIW
jgi:PIN domain nuclease of toxin-antitoxin system